MGAIQPKRHSMPLSLSQSSLPFSALTPPSLPQAFGGALSMTSATIEDLIELQIASLIMKHENVVVEWAPN
jgi:hypothetical protein